LDLTEEIRKARQQEVIWNNVYVAILVVLLMLMSLINLPLSWLLWLGLVMNTVTGLWKVFAVKKPLLPVQWQQTLMNHERKQYGDAAWGSKQRTDGVFLLIGAAALLFLVTTTPLVASETIIYGAFILSIVVLVPLINFSVISKGRTIDTWNFETERGFEFKGHSLKIFIAILCAWIVIFAVGYALLALL